jgi:hypothetical protein
VFPDVQVRSFVSKYFVTKIRLHVEELLAPRPTPKIEDHPLSAAYSIYSQKTSSAYGGMLEACTRFLWEKLREGDHLGDPRVDGRIILKRIFRKCEVGVETGLSWLRIEIGEGHL